jgi:hypothetical protein
MCKIRQSIELASKSNLQNIRKYLGLLLISFLTMSLLIFTPCLYSINDFSPFTSATPLVLVEDEDTLRTAVSSTLEPIVIGITNDIVLTGNTLKISADKDIKLTSYGGTDFYRLVSTFNNAVITVEHQGVLRLDGIIITHTSGVVGSGVNVASGGTLIMYDGKISGNKDASNGGGGVCVTNGVFEMYGGTISNNNSTLFGGGVNIGPGSTFTMYDGVIANNNGTGLCGGGICIDDSLFTMYGWYNC